MFIKKINAENGAFRECAFSNKIKIGEKSGWSCFGIGLLPFFAMNKKQAKV